MISAVIRAMNWGCWGPKAVFQADSHAATGSACAALAHNDRAIVLEHFKRFPPRNTVQGRLHGTFPGIDFEF